MLTLFGIVGILQVLQYLSLALAKHSLQVSHRETYAHLPTI